MDETYTVPSRFGLRAALLATAICAIVVTVTQAIRADLRVVAPVFLFVVLVGLAQMAFGRVPRIASAAVGATLFPGCTWINPWFDGRLQAQPVPPLDLFWLIVCGGLAGYLAGVLLAGIFLLADRLQRDRREAVYAVPRRFGLATVLLATTLFAMLFAFLQYAHARPWELFFYASFVATVCFAQMVLRASPRSASIIAGAVYLPLSLTLFGAFGGRRGLAPTIGKELITNPRWLFLMIVFGTVVGYIGGTLIAGIFLVSDYTVRLVERRKRASTPPLPSDEMGPGEGTLSVLAERAVANRQRAGQFPGETPANSSAR